MKSARTLFLSLAILILSALACQVGGIGTPPAGGEDSIATVVAATLAAIGESEAPGVIPTESAPPLAEAATSTPTPAAAPPPGPTDITAPPVTLKIAYGEHLMIQNEETAAWTTWPVSSSGLSWVAFSDDGKWIIYTNSGELWALNLSTIPPLTPQKLVNSDELDALRDAYADEFSADSLSFDQIVWRPGTHEVYYATQIINYEGSGYYQPVYDLHKINLDTMETQHLLGYQQGGRITFSPDGNLFAAVQGDRIQLFQTDSGMHWDALLFTPVMTSSEYTYLPPVAWSADETYLRVIIPPQDPMATPAQPTTIWNIPANGDPAIPIGQIYPQPFKFIDAPWTKDLQYFAYIGGSYGASTLHLTSAGLESDVIFATGEDIDFLGWSPNNDHFIYRRTDGGLYIGQRSTASTTLIDTTHARYTVHWIDATRFWYIRRTAGLMEIFLYDLSSSTATPIASDTSGSITFYP